MSETIINCHVCGCPTYVLVQKFHHPGVEISKCSPRSQRGIDMVLSKMNSTQIGLGINLFTGSISSQYHVAFDYMFSNVVSSIASYLEVWIRLVTSSNSSIQVMLYQEDYPELDDEYLTDDERLTHFIKARKNIVGRLKVSELLSVQ